MNDIFVNNIFCNDDSFEKKALEQFRFQYHANIVYQSWCKNLRINPDNIQQIQQIPFLPVSFFKTQKVISGSFKPETVFQSSGTTQTTSSNHFIKDISIYKKSFLTVFELFYGNITDWCIIGLLPSYLERKNSSLVMMVDELIKLSAHDESGFYLDDFKKLFHTLQKLEKANQKVLLIGVTFALLDFSEIYSMQLKHTIIMETGGMKGRRKELTRNEVHTILKQKFNVQEIHSEYGMTEMLSQAYAKKDGRFFCPPWMKLLARDEEDPLAVSISGKGVLNVIDLANVYSCSFIATDDVGNIFGDGSFEVWGRLDNSDTRGCSLLVV